ncbi:TniQ protein [Rhizobium sp. PP-CC-2G-626]|nr:TniQ protein [Rhizobium sp. PP-CC-2G-626]
MDECNHLPEMYASEVGVDTIFKSVELLEQIFRLPISEADKERLRHWTPVERNGRISLAGPTFRRNEFRWARRIECRHCIAEVPYQRVWWHLEFFRVCPVHQCSLEPILHGPRSNGRWWPRYSYTASEREVGDFIETAEAVGWLIGNPRQPTVPPFSKADLELGYCVLNCGPSSFIDHFRAWMQASPPPPFAYRIRDLIGWADEYLLSQDRDLDPEVDDVANHLLLDVTDII